MLDLRTTKQRARDERNAKICDAWQALTAEQPFVSPSRKMEAVAQSFGLTAHCVRGILIKNDLYKSKN